MCARGLRPRGLCFWRLAQTLVFRHSRRRLWFHFRFGQSFEPEQYIHPCNAKERVSRVQKSNVTFEREHGARNVRALEGFREHDFNLAMIADPL
jgi:hypothetical protein